MLGFIRQFAPYRGLPIGIDLGESAIRMAQIELVNDEFRLVHAEEISMDPALAGDARSQSITEAIRKTLRSGKFCGRNAAIGIRAGDVVVKHLRMPRTGATEFAASLGEQATTALNAPSSDYLIRGVIAGEIFGEQSPQQEVVLFATPQNLIQQIIDDSAAARLNLVGVHVQQRIAADFFSRVYRRKTDESAVNLVVDLGAGGTRAFVAAPADIRFVRTMPLSVAQIHERVARQVGVSTADAMLIRRSIAALQTAPQNEIAAKETPFSAQQQKLVDETAAAAAKLSDELEMCRRYYESLFPNQPVTRLLFIGGGARDRLLCSAIAQAMSLPAQIGDPLVRFNRSTLPNLACIDRREAMPQWCTAFGLSICGQTIAHV